MLKLSQTAFANSMAILTAAFYLLFYLINLIAPGLFRFLFNAQFLVLTGLFASERICLGEFYRCLGFDGYHGLDFWLRVGLAV